MIQILKYAPNCLIECSFRTLGQLTHHSTYWTFQFHLFWPWLQSVPNSFALLVPEIIIKIIFHDFLVYHLPSMQSIRIHFVIYLALVWYNQRNIHDLHSYNDWDKYTIKSEQLYQILSNDHFRVSAFYPILKHKFNTQFKMLLAHQ